MQGFRFIAGVDEVGMGCLAGPVVAAAVILPLDRVPPGIDDSKKLSAKQREALDVAIRAEAVALSIAEASVEEIDRLNILQAARLAMRRAVGGLSVPPDYLLIDGRFPLDLPIAQQSVVKGDARSVSIGAASIVAKVYRDALMCRFDDEFPGYGFASHKGYGSASHRRSLQEKGQTPLHRKSFSWTPV